MKKRVLILLIIFLVFILTLLSINFYVKTSTKSKIVDSSIIEDIDYILVLGAGIWKDKPSPMLKDRLDVAIDLYKNNEGAKIIMSGDKHDNYSEVDIMKKYAIDNGVNDEDILIDDKGYSTYESIYNTRKLKPKNLVIVTQKYHLFRALFISNKLKINSYGVSATTRKYSGDTYREIREVLARIKDFIKCLN